VRGGPTLTLPFADMVPVLSWEHPSGAPSQGEGCATVRSPPVAVSRSMRGHNRGWTCFAGPGASAHGGLRTEPDEQAVGHNLLAGAVRKEPEADPDRMRRRCRETREAVGPQGARTDAVSIRSRGILGETRQSSCILPHHPRSYLVVSAAWTSGSSLSEPRRLVVAMDCHPALVDHRGCSLCVMRGRLHREGCTSGNSGAIDFRKREVGNGNENSPKKI
jgi:hypothetical protein